MQINDFRLFLEVAALGSFTKVAAQRHTVQSHISRQITDLEKACGGALFRRTGRGVALTEFGTQVEKRVRIWLRDSDALFADIQQSARVPMGEVRLGILPSAAHPLMTRVFSRLRAEAPDIRLSIREGQGGELDTLLDSGSVDMAVLFRYGQPTGHEEVALAAAPTYLVSAYGNTLTAGETVRFRALEGLPLVMPRRPAHWRSMLDESARAQGFQLEAVIEADSLTLQKELVASTPGLYAVLGPFSIRADVAAGRLQASRLTDPDLARHVTLALPRQGKPSPAARVVAAMIRDQATDWPLELGRSE
jgi:LysR family nitrogen assimilation transcriptional regulator